MQTRYDDENVARLLAEKRLKVSKDKQNKLREQSASVNEKIKRLTEQLENNQKSMRELEVELTAEKLKSARDAAQEVPAEQASPDSSFVAAREWVVSGLKFEEGSAAIELGSIGSLEPLVLHLRENDGLAVQVNGYTDNIGSAAYNLKLSQERADAVAGYLVEQGIGVHRIKALGYGERRPLASNDTEQGREKNRRVAVLLLD